MWSVTSSVQIPKEDTTKNSAEQDNSKNTIMKVCNILYIPITSLLYKQVLVNVPAITGRKLWHDIEASGLTFITNSGTTYIYNIIITTILQSCKSDVQTIALDEAAQAHPESWWWLKTDGCDIVKGLKESTKLQWSGDVVEASKSSMKLTENA